MLKGGREGRRGERGREGTERERGREAQVFFQNICRPVIYCTVHAHTPLAKFLGGDLWTGLIRYIEGHGRQEKKEITAEFQTTI